MSTSTIRLSEIPILENLEGTEYGLALTSDGTRLVLLSSLRGVEDVATDGKYYVRRNGAWVGNPLWDHVFVTTVTDPSHATNKQYVDTLVGNAITGVSSFYAYVVDVETDINSNGKTHVAGSIIHVIADDEPLRGSYVVTTDITGPGFVFSAAVDRGDLVNLNTGLGDAPADGASYVRRNNTWTNSPTFNTLSANGSTFHIAPEDGDRFDIQTRNGQSLLVVKNVGTEADAQPHIELTGKSSSLIFSTDANPYIKSGVAGDGLEFKLSGDATHLEIVPDGSVKTSREVWSDGVQSHTITTGTTIQLTKPTIDVTVNANSTITFADGYPNCEYTMILRNTGKYTVTFSNVNISPIISYNAEDVITFRVIDSKYIITNHIKKI